MFMNDTIYGVIFYNDGSSLFFHYQAEVVREEGEAPLLRVRQQQQRPQPLPLLPRLSSSRARSLRK